MGLNFFYTNSRTVLTQEGLFLKRPGDILKALEVLNQEKIFSEVLDTEFAVLFEEAQKRKATLEPYRDEIYAEKVVCQLMKNKTLQNSLAVSYHQGLRHSISWEILLRMNVSGGVFFELVKAFGKEEAKRRNRMKRKECCYHDRQVEGNYTYAFGLFFKTEAELLKATQLLMSQGLEGVRLSTEVALTAFYLQEDIKDKAVGSINLLEVAAKVSRSSTAWRYLLRGQVKSAVLAEVPKIFAKNRVYYEKEWALKYSVEEDYEEFKESLMDTYSPSLRPDLFQLTGVKPKRLSYETEVPSLKERSSEKIQLTWHYGLEG